MSESERPGEPTTHEQETDVRDSTPNSAGPDRAEGGMGVSSERVGPTGPGQVSTDGVRPTHAVERDPDAEVPPEQFTGNPEPQPEGLEPRAGYSSKDPRSG